MAGESEGDFVSGDATAVIGDLDQPPASLADFNTDIGSSCVDAVLQEFLDYGCRPLDDFAGCDLARHFGR